MGCGRSQFPGGNPEGAGSQLVGPCGGDHADAGAVVEEQLSGAQTVRGFEAGEGVAAEELDHLTGPSRVELEP